MSVLLSAQSVVSVEEALAYLRDQGSPNDDQDFLKMHLNAVAAMILKITGRDRILWVDNDEIAEYRDGDGSAQMFLKNAPVRKLTSIVLSPNESTSTAIVVPTGTVTYSDQCHFNPKNGLLVLKSATLPVGPSTVKVVYEAGFYAAGVPNSGDPGDIEVMELKMIALNALARKWARWKGNRHGVSSETKGDQSISFSADDMTKEEVRELRRYRRTMFA